MAGVYIYRSPALRIVNAAGTVVYPTAASGLGSFRLAPRDGGKANYGIQLSKCEVDYVPELIGPFQTPAWENRLTLNGFRPSIRLVFAFIEPGFAKDVSKFIAGSGYGASLMNRLFVRSFEAEDYCALQFNLFAAPVQLGGGVSPWRGVWMKSAWAPRDYEDKSGNGYAWEMQLETRALIAAPGDWSGGVW